MREAYAASKGPCLETTTVYNRGIVQYVLCVATLLRLKCMEPTYRKGNYDATARIAQNYPMAVRNASTVLQNLLQEGMPGLEDTDELNRWLCTKCKTFSTVQEAIVFLEGLQS